MSITNKLNYLRETKELIKQAIIDKGVSVENTDNFRSYSTKISEISGADPRNTLNVNSDKAKYFYYQADGDNAFFNVYGINWNAWYEDFNNYDIVIPESIGKNNEPTIYNSNITRYTKPNANFFRDTPHSYTIDKNARFENDKLRIKAENGRSEYITKSIDVPETVKDISSFVSAADSPSGLRSDQQIVVNLSSNVENLAYAFSCSSVYKVNFDKAVNIQDLYHCFAGYNYTYRDTYNQEIDLRHLIKKDIGMGQFLSNARVFNKPIYFPDSVRYLGGCFHYATSFNQDIILPNNGQYSSLDWFLCDAFSFRSNVTIPKNNTKIFNLYYAFNNTKIQNLIVDNETFKVSDLRYAFSNSLLNHIPQWFNNVPPTVNINSAFSDTQISNIDLSNALAVNFISTFSGCKKIQGDILFNAPINLNGCFSYSFTNKDNIYTNSIIYKDKNNLTNISYMFAGCRGFNGNIELNDCPKLENISYLFGNCSSFNKPVNFVGSPNISYAENAFCDTTNFNQEVNLAEQKKLVNIDNILNSSINFNSPINFANCISLYNIDNAFCNLRQMNSEVNFYGCTSVKYIDNSFDYWVEYNKPFNFQWFPNLIVGLGWCSGWYKFNQEVNISNLPQLTTLQNCFSYCSSLDKNIIIDNCPKLTTLSNFLWNCNNFNSNLIVTNCPSITSIDNLFKNCSSFNQELRIDYPSVTSMWGLFYNCYSLNKPITFNIGVSKSLGSSFYGCSIFNQPINIKSISPVITDVRYMFADCRMFNQPIDLSSSFTLTDASHMLHNDTSFDQPVNLSGCTNLNDISFMFGNCSKFNKEVNIQGCLNLNNFYSTFKNCYKFNQPIKFENNRLFLNNAFENCYELKQIINIPDGQTTIGSNAFYECTNAIVELPTSITSIAKRAFEGVPELRYKGTLNAAANSNWGALSLVTDW